MNAPNTIWLQWNGPAEACETGSVSVPDVTWCGDQVFDGDVEYVRADLVSAALLGHKCSKLLGDAGLLAATARSVKALQSVEDELVDIAEELRRIDAVPTGAFDKNNFPSACPMCGRPRVAGWVYGFLGWECRTHSRALHSTAANPLQLAQSADCHKDSLTRRLRVYQQFVEKLQGTLGGQPDVKKQTNYDI